MGKENLRDSVRIEQGTGSRQKPTAEEYFIQMVDRLRALSTEGTIVGDEARAVAQDEVAKLAARVRGASRDRSQRSGMLHAFDAVLIENRELAKSAFGALLRGGDSRTAQDIRGLIGYSRKRTWRSA